MPFRQRPSVRKLLEQFRRTGEPPLAKAYKILEDLTPPGYGKAKGSYTEEIRQQLFAWLKEKTGSYFGSVTFQYKLTRLKTITVTARNLYFKHNPSFGKGNKGFILLAKIESINGILYRGVNPAWFLWSRIFGREKMLCLPEGKSNGN